MQDWEEVRLIPSQNQTPQAASEFDYEVTQPNGHLTSDTAGDVMT
jgi:hypothetical protein